MTTDYQSQLQKIESDIQALETVKKDLEQKIAAEQRSEDSKRYHRLVEDIKQLGPEFHKHGYELIIGTLDDMFYSIDVTLEHTETKCAFVYYTISGLDDAAKALPVLQHILRTSCRSLDTVVGIAQRVYEVYEFPEGTTLPFEIDYFGSKIPENDHFELSFVYHGSYHGLSRDINIEMTFSTEDGQPSILSMSTDLSDSDKMTSIEVSNFPYDFDVSVSNGYQDIKTYAKVQMSHLETLDSKNTDLIDETVNTIRDFARTAEKLIITQHQ